MKNSCIVFVFSFNRGRFLENAVSSLEKNLPDCPLVIVDDHSEDSETKKILDRLREKYSVHSPSGDEESSLKHGGLYACMNLAMEIAVEREAAYAVFLQDDMQLVRPWLQEDWARIGEFFERNPRSAQLSLTFFKNDDRGQWRLYSLAEGKSAYFRLAEDWRNIAFSDTGIFHVQRIRNVLPRFPAGELTADRILRQAGYRVGFYAYPLIMFLPLPPTWRGKRRSPFYRLAEWLGQVGLYPYEELAQDDLRRLLDRDIEELPIGDEWLDARNLPSCRVVSYEGGFNSLRAHGAFRQRLRNPLRRLDGRWQGLRRRLFGG